MHLSLQEHTQLSQCENVGEICKVSWLSWVINETKFDYTVTDKTADMITGVSRNEVHTAVIFVAMP